MKVWLLRAAVVLGGLGLLGGLAMLSGIVPIKASSGHWAVTAWLLDFAKRRSVATHSLGVKPPPLEDRRLLLIGAGHYEGGCRPCHGAPGVRPPRIATRMTPPSPALGGRVTRYEDAELFQIVRHGIKFTGMPAWPAEKRDDEVWAVVAFLRALPKLDRPAYDQLVQDPGVEAGGAPSVVARRCARCHGHDGLGRGAFPRLAGQRVGYLTATLRAYARGYRYSGIMGPIAAELEEREIAAIGTWYAALPPAAGTPATDLARGEAIVRRGIADRRIPACSQCHGPRASGTPAHRSYPLLDAQHAAYLEQQLHLFTQGARGGAQYAELMHQAVTDHALHGDEIKAVARYYAALTGTQP
jgi:cytochrome c553